MWLELHVEPVSGGHCGKTAQYNPVGAHVGSYLMEIAPLDNNSPQPATEPQAA